MYSTCSILYTCTSTLCTVCSTYLLYVQVLNVQDWDGIVVTKLLLYSWVNHMQCDILLLLLLAKHCNNYITITYIFKHCTITITG